MINCNPETVSTDYDVADKLYFEPLTYEDVLNVIELEKTHGRHRPVRGTDTPETGPAPRRSRCPHLGNLARFHRSGRRS